MCPKGVGNGHRVQHPFPTLLGHLNGTQTPRPHLGRNLKKKTNSTKNPNDIGCWKWASGPTPISGLTPRVQTTNHVLVCIAWLFSWWAAPFFADYLGPQLMGFSWLVWLAIHMSPTLPNLAFDLTNSNSTSVVVGLKSPASTSISPSLISPESKSLSTIQILGPTKSALTIILMAAKSPPLVAPFCSYPTLSEIVT